MIGKYKLIGGLVGSATASYGGYEIYNQFSPSFATASNLKDELGTEEIEEESNKDLLSQEKQLEDAIEDNVVDQPEIPKLEEKLEPKVSSPEIPIKPTPKTQLSSKKSQENKEESKRRIQEYYFNEDGTIRIIPGTLGSRFRDYLITAPKDDPVWASRVKDWNDDLKYHEDGKNTMRSHRNPIPKGFLLIEKEVVNIESLQKRCFRAYIKKEGDASSIIKNSHNKGLEVEQYGTLVGKYCGKPKMESPKGWGRG